jgi:hypothetical protein
MNSDLRHRLDAFYQRSYRTQKVMLFLIAVSGGLLFLVVVTYKRAPGLASGVCKNTPVC